MTDSAEARAIDVAAQIDALLNTENYSTSACEAIIDDAFRAQATQAEKEKDVLRRHIAAMHGQLAEVEGALRRLKTTRQTDDDGNVTPEWNAAYIAASDALASAPLHPKEEQK